MDADYKKLAEAHFNKRARHHAKRYMPRRLTFFLIAIALLISLLGAPYLGLAADQQRAPQDVQIADFTTTVIGNTGGLPTALAATPDGRLLIANQGGRLRVYDLNQNYMVGSAALDVGGISCTDSEQGLEGVAVDPNFSANHYIYIYHTYCANSDRYNRVVRYVLNNDNTTSGATPLLTHIPAICGNHNGGDLKFGSDGLLYISVGDGGCGTGNDRARDWSTMSGKILRINADGSIPISNPWVNPSGNIFSTRRCSGSGESRQSGVACQEAIVRGLRNPFRLAFKQGSSQWYINDVGQGTWEEINEGQVGGDYGWNQREGFCVIDSSSNCGGTPSGMIDPIIALSHNDGYCSVTGGAFAVGGNWPAPYDNGYFFGDYCKSNVYFLNMTSGTPSVENFASGSYAIVAVMFDSNTRALYFTSQNGDVRRVTYTGNANRAPSATVQTSATSGPVPLTVEFNAVATDPDGDPVTAAWDFGDGSTGTDLSTSHTYNSAGVFTAKLTVTDNKGAVGAPVQIPVYPGNTAPNPVITSPSADKLFRVGEVITLSGTANDAEDGDVSSSLSWKVWLHHVSYRLPGNEHTHPFLSKTGSSVQITAPPPEDIDAAPLSYIEIQLTAVDKAGVSSTITQTLQPNRVSVTLNTSPSGLIVDANGTRFVASSTFTYWEGAPLNLSTLALQEAPSSQYYNFNGWSDNGAITHTVQTLAPDMSITATFVPSDTAPVAIAVADVLSGAGPLLVNFDASQSRDPNGDALSFGWDFGDGQTSSELRPAHIYTADGEYTAQLTVTDSTGIAAKAPPLQIHVGGPTNTVPNALISSAAPRPNAPLSYLFSSDGSSDAEGDLLTYHWDFGDGAQSSEANPSHNYASAGQYLVILTVSDGVSGESAPAQLIINAESDSATVNQPPQPKLDATLANVRFSVGQVLTLTGSATDPEGENVNDNQHLRWTVIARGALLANDVRQGSVVFTGTGSIVRIGPLLGPASLNAATDAYYEVQLTAIDSKGASRTVSQSLLPNRVPLTLETVPAGMPVMVNGTTMTGTQTVTAWQDQTVTMAAPALQQANATFYKFTGWSNGGNRTQTIKTPATAKTYTANFEPVTVKQIFMAVVQR